MDETRKVLVTGATGFVGRATVVALAEAGWQIIRGVRTDDVSSVSGVAHLDLADPATILALAKGPHCDAIVHLGAHVDLSGEAESDMYVPNVLSTGCLAYLAKLWDAHLVFASTAIVHGVRSTAISSASPVSLDTPYAKGKWLGEQLIEASAAKHCILRIAGVFGHSGPTHLGLNHAIDGAIRGEPPVQFGSGSALRNYLYVKDVAQAVVYALQARVTGVHLLAGYEVISVSEMLRQICETFIPGRQPQFKEGPQAIDQIVTPSADLPRARGFCDALNDIRKDVASEIGVAR